MNEFVSDTLLSSASRERGLYRPDVLADIVNRQGVGSRQLWGALNLELWFQTYIDGGANARTL